MAQVERIVGIYEADGGLVGEILYALRKFTGRGHCSLCDITHRGVKPKAEWSALCEQLSVPVELMHLNERHASLRHASEGHTPCVIAEIDGALQIILEPADLEACNGDVGAFGRALVDALHHRGIAIS